MDQPGDADQAESGKKPESEERPKDMDHPAIRRSEDGFTLIEAVAATALLTVVCAGFLMMTAADARLSARESRLDHWTYELSARAGEGQGEAAGETLEVEFILEGNGTYTEDRVNEIFERYDIRESGEALEGRMTYYRHR